MLQLYDKQKRCHFSWPVIYFFLLNHPHPPHRPTATRGRQRRWRNTPGCQGLEGQIEGIVSVCVRACVFVCMYFKRSKTSPVSTGNGGGQRRKSMCEEHAARAYEMALTLWHQGLLTPVLQKLQRSWMFYHTLIPQTPFFFAFLFRKMSDSWATDLQLLQHWQEKNKIK